MWDVNDAELIRSQLRRYNPKCRPSFFGRGVGNLLSRSLLRMRGTAWNKVGTAIFAVGDSVLLGSGRLLGLRILNALLEDVAPDAQLGTKMLTLC